MTSARRRRQQGGVDRLPSGRWRVRVIDPGTGGRVSLGSYTRKGDAERAYATAVADQNRGLWVDPATVVSPWPPTPLLGSQPA